MNNIFIPLINSFVLTVCFLASIIAFQADIASLFGISSISPAKFSVLKDLLLPVFAAFGGAISGAFIAFKLQTEKEKKTNSKKNLSYINRTIFTLQMQLNDLINIKEQGFVPFQDNEVRFLTILPMANDITISDEISMDFAQILIDEDLPELVQNILIAEKKYLNIINLLQTRNDLKNEIDALMEHHGFGHNTSFNLGHLNEYIGQLRIAKMYDLTEFLINSIDDSIAFIYKIINSLTNESEKIFKNFKGKRIKIIVDDKMRQSFVPMSKPYFKTKNDLFIKIENDLKHMS